MKFGKSIIRLAVFAIGFLGIVQTPDVWAVPPLVTGDVPTADRGHLETFLGWKYQETGQIVRQIPFAEVVYGLTSWEKITLEVPYLAITPSNGEGKSGVGDMVLGTKVGIVSEAHHVPGIAASFEVKLANGDETQGLGSGAVDYDVRLRFQKSWWWFTGIWNVGYTLVGEPTIEGVRQERNNVLFGAFAQMWELTPGTQLLTEIYAQNSDEPGEPNRIAANVGFAQKLWSWLQVHGTIGKSIQQDDEGGPKLRAYLGMKLEFPLIK